jgi:hypothetical protein
MSLKNRVIPPGIDPGTARLVVQRLNHYAPQAPTLHHISRKSLSSFRVVTDRWTDGGQIRRKRERTLQNGSPQSVLYHFLERDRYSLPF